MLPSIKSKVVGRSPRRHSRFLFGVGLLLNLFNSGVIYADSISDWNAIAATAAVTNANRAPNPANIDITYVQVAIYDAVNAIDGRYTPFAVALNNVAPGASLEAATAAAAYTVLKTLYPTHQAYLDPIYAADLAGISNGQANDQGIDIVTTVTRFLALRAPTSPLVPWLVQMKPFAIQSASQFRAEGPPNLTSAERAKDFNEAKECGAGTGSLRTPEIASIARFYLEHPGSHLRRNMHMIAASKGMSTADNARFFAHGLVPVADSEIACWDSKFSYNFWRPETAIREADAEGNDATEADAAWLPLAATPAHHDYPLRTVVRPGPSLISLRISLGQRSSTSHSTVARFQEFPWPSAPSQTRRS